MRIKKLKGEPATVIAGWEDSCSSMIRLIGTGKRSYLHVENVSGRDVALSHFSGTASLRALAKAILKEVGP